MNVFILANIWSWAIPLAIALIFILWAGGIPDLVETVKGIMKHERETLEAVIQARNSAVAAKAQTSANIGDPDSMGALIAAEAGLQGALGNLFALSESYPD